MPDPTSAAMRRPMDELLEEKMQNRHQYYNHLKMILHIKLAAFWEKVKQLH